jgi:hypothetical protein
MVAGGRITPRCDKATGLGFEPEGRTYLVETMDEGSPRAERIVVTATSYEVVVKGRLGPTLLAAFDAFEVTGVEHGQTHFIGWMIDQARLHSMLEQLRDLNIELISVNPLPDTNESRLQDGVGRLSD